MTLVHVIYQEHFIFSRGRQSALPDRQHEGFPLILLRPVLKLILELFPKLLLTQTRHLGTAKDEFKSRPLD